MKFLKSVFHPVVEDDFDLRRYVASVTLFSWAVSMATEAVNQAFSGLTLAASLREFLVSTVTVLVIAVPVARAMGRAHLQLFRARKEAERLSRTDPLTGLANRRAFYDAVADRPAGALALAIVDIDRFKRFNDRYGHAIGDEIIKAVARRMEAELGDLGAVARLGGEEFALVTDDRRAGGIAMRLQQFRQRVADEPVSVAGQSIYATVSIGFAKRDGFDFEKLYAAADQALYVAKASGRDRVVDYELTRDIPKPDPAALRLAG